MVSADSLAGKFNLFACPAVLLAASRTLVQTLPAPLGLRIVRALAGRSQRPHITPPQQQAMDKARALVYGPHDTHADWAWGQGPLVNLVHGWVGHSAGAMTLMAARAHGRIQGRRYASICGPSHPFPPERVLQRYREHIAQQFGFAWDELKAGAVWRDAGPQQLLFYDETDRFVPHTEGDTIAALCPGARLIKTNGYSHTKILSAPEMLHAVSEFVAADEPAP